MSQGGFELTIPVCEQAKTVHAYDRAATLMGNYAITASLQILPNSLFINISTIYPIQYRF
jgi:hypothetical protein